MQFHELTRSHPNTTSRRVGRGGKRGKTAGRGTKGQKSRAGHRMRPELRDIIKKYPKHRGYKFNSHAVKPAVVNLTALEATFAAGEAVNPTTLLEKKLISLVGGKVPEVKILGTGTITKKLSVTECLFSKTAQEKIAACGGSIA